LLVELAAANAAFAVIKEAVQNSGELMSAGKAVVDYFTAKTAIQKKVEEAPHDGRGDLEEFFALEELKKREQELKDLMIIQGRPGLWDDWLKFQSQAKRKRDQAARDKELAELKKKEELEELFNNVMISLGIAVLLGILIFIVYWVFIFEGLK
jgi:hypothetical protein